MKLCVFQGTFNPIHNGHLQMASYVRDNTDYNFDKILFIPAYKPPHKNIDNSLAFHRLNMTKLAVENQEKFEVSDIEFQKEGLSYTIHTIKELYEKYDIEEEISFIIGLDAFKGLPDWHGSEELKELVHFLIFSRDQDLDKDRSALLNYKQYKFDIIKMQPVDISSTMVRDKTVNKRPIGTYVPKAVEEYIKKYGLYRN